ncbi:MAG: DUF192 domain-containing protein [Anaerolineaceae bacterium]
MKTRILTNPASPFTKIQIKYCENFMSKLKGLMFSKQIPLDEGIILVENKESKINTSIHMMFMNFDLTVLWLDKELVVVDKVLAKRWVPIYFPKSQAQYVVELHSKQFRYFSIGDQLFLSDFT